MTRRMPRLLATLAAGMLIAGGMPERAAAASDALTSAPQSVFDEANGYYRSQDFARAYELYGRLAEARRDLAESSPDLQYNLGNAAAQLGKTGEAVYHYEKAKALAPRDGDISANLKRVAPAGNDGPRPALLAMPFVGLARAYSLREWLGLFFTLATLAGLAWAARIAWPPPKAAVSAEEFPTERLAPHDPARRVLRMVSWLALAATVVVGAFAMESWSRAQAITVVLRSSPPDGYSLRSGPGENFLQVATIKEGAKMRRLEFNDPTWAFVRLADGREGYMPSKDLGTI